MKVERERERERERESRIWYMSVKDSSRSSLHVPQWAVPTLM